MEARRPKNPTEMEGKNSGSRAGKLRSYRRERRGIHRRSHNSFSSNARSEAFSGCHAGCHGKLYSRRFLGIFRLEQRWIGHIVRLGSHSPPIDGMSMLALFGHGVMFGLSPLCEQQRKSAKATELW